MGKIIAIANQKGGVGKTTTCVNLCSALHAAGVRVLLVDIDPQGNATTSMGINKNTIAAGTYELLTGDCDRQSVVVHTKYGDVIPSNKELSGAGIELVTVSDREHMLKKALQPFKNEYDYLIIDCPPSLEMLTLNALCAADSVLIPVQCEFFALEGLGDLMNTVRLIRRKMNPDIDIEGVVMTMYDGRTNLSAQVMSEVKKYFKNKVFKSVIPRNVRLSEAPSHGKPIADYDPGSKGAQAYGLLAQELIKRNSKQTRSW